MQILPRHLPPAATPLSWQQWWAGWKGNEETDGIFARAIADYVGVQAAFPTASGRTALFALLGTLKAHAQKERSEVLLPAYTCPALVKVIRDLSLIPRPIEIEPETLDYVHEDLRAQLSAQALAVIVVHPFGMPVPIEPVLNASYTVGAIVIEDAAQALGAKYRGLPVGARGDFAIFSFGPGKPLSTGGGGIFTANHPHTVAAMREAWEHLQTPSGRQRSAAQLRLALFNTAFRPTPWWFAAKLGAQGYGNQPESWGYRELQLTNAQASVGQRLLNDLDEINRKRKQNAQALIQMLNKTDLLKPTHLPFGADPAYLRLPLLANDKNARDRLHKAFWRAGIGAGKMYGRSLDEIFPDIAERSFPGARDLAGRLLTLPTHHFLKEADLEKVEEVLHNQAFGNKQKADVEGS